MRLILNYDDDYADVQEFITFLKGFYPTRDWADLRHLTQRVLKVLEKCDDLDVREAEIVIEEV